MNILKKSGRSIFNTIHIMVVSCCDVRFLFTLICYFLTNFKLKNNVIISTILYTVHVMFSHLYLNSKPLLILSTPKSVQIYTYISTKLSPGNTIKLLLKISMFSPLKYFSGVGIINKIWSFSYCFCSTGY